MARRRRATTRHRHSHIIIIIADVVIGRRTAAAYIAPKICCRSVGRGGLGTGEGGFDAHSVQAVSPRLPVCTPNRNQVALAVSAASHKDRDSR